MDTPFVYNKFVTGHEFISRQNELSLFTTMVRQKQHVLIYEPPKSGKKSLVQQGFINLHKNGHEFIVCNINLFNVRTKKQLLQKYINALLNTFTNSPAEMENLQKELIPDFDKFFGKTIEYGKTLDFSDPETDTRTIPKEITEKIISLPETLAHKFNTNPVIYIDEFQEILLQDNPYEILEQMEYTLKEQVKTTYIITGSMVNSMKEIFEEKKYFYNFAERIKLGPLDGRSLSEFYNKSFLKTGRVISRELSTAMYNFTEGHPWYAQQLGDISYGLTRGYLTEQVLKQSFLSLLELHSYRYQLITSRLSRFQINFLKAIMDNVEQLCAADTMSYYGFNSSANVKRLKDAVKRKEILTEENGQWVFLDPLFKTWLKTVYFEL
ncbi:MAG: ATP-binding protein [Bacteroidia bacterium]|nr:ATP-binding protein [Bacteroidia bacterium]